LHEYAEGIEPERDVPAAGRARYRRLVWRRRATAVLGSAVAVIAVAGIGVGVARRPGHTLGVQTGGHSSTTVATGVPSTTAVATTAAPGPIVTGESPPQAVRSVMPSPISGMRGTTTGHPMAQSDEFASYRSLTTMTIPHPRLG